MSKQTAVHDRPIKIVMSEKLQIAVNDDGTITRINQFPESPASCSDLTLPALSKDFTIDHSNNTWLRLYLPRQVLHYSPPQKLPVLLHFHGGGLVFLTAAASVFHDFCANLAAETGSLVASVDFRLAPEHRLPAAYDDALDALRWLSSAVEDVDWVRDHADLSRCFLIGGSGGGNVVYGAGLRAAAEEEGELGSATVRGLILQQPFFGGASRTASELRLEHNVVLPLCVTDLLWELALPHGAGRDHVYCNPVAGDGPEMAATIAAKGWRVLVSASYDDPLFDRQAETAKMLEEKGVKVVSHFGPGNHGSDLFDPTLVKQLFLAIKQFISSSN